MAQIDLNELYDRSQKEGVITDAPATGSDADLEALYNQSKKDGVIQPTQTSTQPQGNRIDIMAGLAAGAKSAMNPSSNDLSLGGLDIAQRFGQVALGNIYSQGRGIIQNAVPDTIKQRLGQATPGIGPLLPSQAQKAIGNQAIGLGVDVGSAIGAGAVSSASDATINGLKALAQKMPNATIRRAVGDAARAVSKIEGGFAQKYESMFDSKGNKFVPNALKEKIKSTIEEVSREVAPDSPFANYLDALDSRLSRINGKELHALKQEVFNKRTRIGANKGASSKVYDTLSEILSDPSMYGDEYRNITFDYKQYLTKEKNYIDGLIYDKNDNLTADKLSSGKVSTEDLKALKRLSTRAGLNRDVGKVIKAARSTKEIGKKAIEYAPWVGAGSYISYRVLRDILK